MYSKVCENMFWRVYNYWFVFWVWHHWKENIQILNVDHTTCSLDDNSEKILIVIYSQRKVQ